MTDATPARVFISYSWTRDEHTDWAADLSEQLTMVRLTSGTSKTAMTSSDHQFETVWRRTQVNRKRRESATD